MSGWFCQEAEAKPHTLDHATGWTQTQESASLAGIVGILMQMIPGQFLGSSAESPCGDIPTHLKVQT